MDMTRTVYTLDSRHLDVGRGGWAGEKCQRQGRSRSETREGLGHLGDDVLGVQDADMDVRHERSPTAPLSGDALENDRPGFGDGESAECDGSVEAVEFGRRK